MDEFEVHDAMLRNSFLDNQERENQEHLLKDDEEELAEKAGPSDD